ncbi:MAG: tRNA pseudouridine(54/55) synthase Pus10 [Candidatus Diapherotrites archaeon]|nr:tRNA pseudouridine(54/55) synthase Pus10 [Candidatus Diapherotrites archaeon]
MLSPIPFSFESKFDSILKTHLVSKISESLSAYENPSFLAGFIWPKDFSKEQILDLKANFQQNLTSELSKALHSIPDFQNPVTSIYIDFTLNQITFHIQPVYIFGHYKKFSRTITQTFPYCFHCKGQSCRLCNFTGREPCESVQEIIAEPAQNLFQSNDNKFHGAGREDQDVRMLGNGRAFVLELIDPQKRSMDLSKLEQEINSKNQNKVEVIRLQYCLKAKIAEIKEAKFSKIYLAEVTGVKPFVKEKLLSLKNQTFELNQATPQRVQYRRAELIRKKRIKVLDIVPKTDCVFEIKLEAEAGAYIKEFISSDQNRTKPSLAELLNNVCDCTALDVLEIIEN